MRTGSIQAFAVTAVVAVGLTGCSVPGESMAGAPVSGASARPSTSAEVPSAEPPAMSSAAPSVVAPSGAVNDDTGEVVGQHPAPVWDKAAHAAATRAATTAMEAFARPHLKYDSWWADLEPLLTYQAAVDYSGTDPASVPASKVTGPATVAAGTSAYLASVTVPTDVGRYTVLLVRADGDAPWLVEKLDPPEGKG